MLGREEENKERGKSRAGNEKNLKEGDRIAWEGKGETNKEGWRDEKKREM